MCGCDGRSGLTTGILEQRCVIAAASAVLLDVRVWAFALRHEEDGRQHESDLEVPPRCRRCAQSQELKFHLGTLKFHLCSVKFRCT